MAPEHPLFVTRPSLPPLEEMLPLLEDIWNRRVLTNDGTYHQLLEAELGRYLGVEHLCLVQNATLGLLLALRQAKLSGEVITTPFTFVGTAHAISLAGLEPVFVDIDRHSLNLNPALIEAAITPRTTAIMPVHVFGRACDTSVINEIARRHGLRVIYDAAHAFGIRDGGGSVLRHGDMSVLSFHATKVFNTFEGGAIVCADAATKADIDLQRNFGIVDEVTVSSVGLNAKLNEFSAALGVVQLRHIDDFIARRAAADALYRELLQNMPGIDCLPVPEGQSLNHYHFPVLVNGTYGADRDALHNRLRSHGIHARRYFYPLVSDHSVYSHLPSAQPRRLPVAQDIAQRILCLPLFPDITVAEQQRIVEIMAGPSRMAV